MPASDANSTSRVRRGAGGSAGPAVGEAYPADAATGFEPGELRGAVRVRWPAGD